jgi:hypothetical protein
VRAFLPGAAVAVAAVGTACGAGTGGADVAAAPRGNLTIADARAFDEYPLVYAGERVVELPLVAVVRRDDTARYVSFVYGDCRASAEAGCAPPAEIQVWPAESRHAAVYDSAAPGTPIPERTTIRGSPAAFFDDGTRLEIYLERVTVVVFSDSRARVLEIARALRCLARPPPGDADRRLDC